jgi:hypothetical protein
MIRREALLVGLLAHEYLEGSTEVVSGKSLSAIAHTIGGLEATLLECTNLMRLAGGGSSAILCLLLVVLRRSARAQCCRCMGEGVEKLKTDGALCVLLSHEGGNSRPLSVLR